MDIEISELFSKFLEVYFFPPCGKGYVHSFTPHSLYFLYTFSIHALYREFILFLYFLTDQSLGFAKNKVL